MTRPTRRETQEQTRTRLLGTATDLFLADGYHATSLGQVADVAGYTKGAVYSNFATKQDLGLAVLDKVLEERAEALLAALGPADSAEALVTGFAAWAEQHIGDVGWTALEVEFAAGTRHLPEVRERLALRRQGITSLLGELLRERADTLHLDLPVPPEDAATHVLALGIGLGVQRAFDPTLSVDVLVDHVAWLVGRERPRRQTARR